MELGTIYEERLSSLLMMMMLLPRIAIPFAAPPSLSLASSVVCRGMHYISDAEVRARVDCATCIKLQRSVFIAKAAGQVIPPTPSAPPQHQLPQATMAPRALLPGPASSTAFVYLARAHASGRTVCKVCSTLNLAEIPPVSLPLISVPPCSSALSTPATAHWHFRSCTPACS